MTHYEALVDVGVDAECTVCRSDTPRLCSSCGDPVCQHCACPNGCEDEVLWTPAAA